MVATSEALDDGLDNANSSPFQNCCMILRNFLLPHERVHCRGHNHRLGVPPARGETARPGAGHARREVVAQTHGEFGQGVGRERREYQNGIALGNLNVKDRVGSNGRVCLPLVRILKDSELSGRA